MTYSRIYAALLAFFFACWFAERAATAGEETSGEVSDRNGSSLAVAKQETAGDDGGPAGSRAPETPASAAFPPPARGKASGDARDQEGNASAPPRPSDAPAVPREMTVPGIDYELVYIPAGEFSMGSPEGEGYDNERPRHKVYLEGYYMGKHEVTVGQFRRFCETTSRQLSDQMGHGDKDPVISVTWHDAVAFCAWAGMRLPTEAEWEKAARGGTQTTFPWGDVASHNMANYTGRAGADVWDDVSPVGKFPPNAYGLHDSAGNVWEWVQDRYSETYYATSPDRNPTGPDTGGERSLRGGSWDGPADFMRCARRAFDLPDYESDLLGFRCAKSR